MRRNRSRLIVAASVIAAATWVSPTVDAGPSGGALPPQLVLEVAVTDVAGIPASVAAVAMNVTVVNPSGDGFATVYPCDEDEPNTSNLNYRAGVTVPNAVISRVDPDGYVCVSTFAATDVLIDIAGYFPTNSPLTPLNNPERILDTRGGNGAPAARINPGTTLEFQVGGKFSTPPDASAAVINMTAVNASAAGFATVYPCGQPVPNTSNLNFGAGQTAPSLVIARLGANGKVCVTTSVTIDLLADVSGYFPAGAPGYTAIDNPERVLDTRNGIGARVGRAPSNTELGFQVIGKAGVPSAATAVALNVTATQSSAAGFTTVYACGTPVPVTSNLNFGAAMDVPNLVIAKIGVDGRVCTRSSTDVGLIADVAGYFVGAAAYMPLASPYRAADTRTDGELRCNLAVSTMANNSVTVTDLNTGAQRIVSNPLMVATAIRPALLADCSGFIAAVPSSPSGVVSIIEFSFTGLATPLSQRSIGFELYVTDDGTAIAIAEAGVWDVRTNLQLVNFSGVRVGIAPTNAAGVTADGIAATQFYSFGSGWGLMHYWDIYTGAYLGTGPSPQIGGVSTKAEISRYGTYVSGTPGAPVVGPISVQSLDGVSIVTSPFILTGPYAWIGDGSILACQDDNGNPGVYRWDLFSAPTLLYRGPCPATAG